MPEVLYTPWRLAYLTQGTPTLDGECLFCGLPRYADEEALIVHRGTHAFVVLNRFPYTNGHVMVAPYAHRARLSQLEPEERRELVELAAEAERHLTEEYGMDGLNAGLNLGKAAGAGVADHLHLHLVPRWNGDTNFMTVLAGVRTVPEHLDVTFAKLAARFRATPGGRS